MKNFSNEQLKKAHRMLLLSSCRDYTCKMFEYMNKTPYIIGEHHKMIFDALDDVIKGKTRKLIINIAPRYGKTEICSRKFIAYGFAINPSSKFLHLSYSGSLTQDNSMSIKDEMNSEYYKQLFEARIRFGTRSKWNTEQGGGLYATSTLGQITGFGAGKTDSSEEEEIIDYYTAYFNPNNFSGAIVIDDPIKPEDALSDNIREQVNRRFETTIRNRVNSRKTPIIIIMQRLHEHDLCGYLQQIEPNEWKVLSIPCITTDENGNEKALWEFKHTLDELYDLRTINPFVFETQYMQNPKPLEGLMYTSFKTYDTLPVEKGFIKAYFDTADTGADFLCGICYKETSSAIYVLDILYTDKPMDYTEPESARMLVRNKVQIATIESNNGGTGFARNVERNVRVLGDTKMRINTIYQGANKLTRIFTHSSDVENMIYYPSNWMQRFSKYALAMTSYRKEGRNAHDDAPDATTGVIEMFNVGKSSYDSDLGSI